MRKDILNARGTLAKGMSMHAQKIEVDPDLELLLSSALLEGDWVYLALRGGRGNYEIVKLSIELGTRVISRSQDYTSRYSFVEGDTVEWAFVTENISDSIPNLSIASFGALTLTENSLEYMLPNFEDAGASQVVPSEAQIVIGRDSQAYGCCASGAGGAIGIGDPYIYLTSKTYPYAILELGISSEGARFTEGVHWTIPYEALESLGGVFTESSFYGGQISHTQPVEDAIVSEGAEITEAYFFGGAIEHSQPAEDAIVAQLMSFVEVIVYGGSISFEQFPSDAIQVTQARFIEASYT